jgi:hypothetical protein
LQLTSRALLLALVASALGCDWLPSPFRVDPSAGGATLDVQTLGEYPTSISRIRISNDRGKVIWDARARGRAPQIRTVKLRCGSNSVLVPEYPEYQTSVPKSPTFVLHAKETYIAEVWNRHALLPARASFSLWNCS